MESDIRKIVSEFCDECEDITELDEAWEKLENFFRQKGVAFALSIDEMFDSPGLDVSSFSIAWIENGKPELIVYRNVRY